jgi:hypothetical protein
MECDAEMSERRIVNVTAELETPEDILVELDNGVVIVLSLVPMLDEPKFAEIRELSMPRTDGGRVYWVNGASLTVAEIMKLLKSVR